MKTKQLVFTKNSVNYDVFVTYKFQRNIYFRYKDDGFHVSAPRFTKDKTIIQGIDKFFDRLLIQHKSRTSHYSFEEDYIYILGEKIALSSLNINSEEELEKYLKTQGLGILTTEVRKYEQIMGIKIPYKVKIRDTKNQFGSNSKKTHTLSFQKSLVHFSLEILDTVVVHELAHEFERNHQKGFYDIVYKYSPYYDYYQKKLKKGIHK